MIGFGGAATIIVDRRRRFLPIVTIELSPPPPPKGPSLQTKLPLLIAGVLMLVVVVGAFLAYHHVRALHIEARSERVERASRELARLVDEAVQMRVRELRAAAQNPAVQALLRGTAPADTAAVRAVLQELDSSDEVLMRVVMRGSDRTPVLSVGRFPTHWGAAQIDSARAIASVPSAGGYSELLSVGGRTFVWVLAPVVVDGDRLGEVAIFRTVRQSSGSPLRELIGRGSQFYFANATRREWITLEGAVFPAPVHPAPLVPTIYRHADGDLYLGHGTTTEGGAFTVVADFPMSVVLERPHAFARQMAIATILLLLAGVTGTWLVSRSLLGPIRSLMRASAEIAAGDYGTRVHVDRTDELGQLARTFSLMAVEVEDAHGELQRRYEAAQEMAETLEATNRQLTETVDLAERMRREAEAANRAKSEFIAVMSHELRTPMNAMIGYTDLLRLEIPGKLNDEQRAQVDRIRASGHHLVSLIGGVLDLAHVESGHVQMDRSPERADEAISQAVAVVAPQAATKGLRLLAPEPDEAGVLYQGDPDRVRQILINLLSNAVKFTAPGGTVEIAASGGARCASHDGSASESLWVSITVRDTGRGIEEDELESIFEPFVQSRNSVSQGGIGLGLAISRRLARMMGGDLTVTSAPGTGAAFSLLLPAPTAEAPATQGLGAAGDERPAGRVAPDGDREAAPASAD